MIELFEVTIALIFWFCYTMYKNYSNKKYKEKVNDVALNENRWFATKKERDEFKAKGDAVIDEVSDDMIKLFGDDWKDKFVWHNFNSAIYSTMESNMTIGWEAVTILYFAKRGKILTNRYKVLPNRINDNIVFFKYIEGLIKEKDQSMRLIFVHDMIPDLYEKGKCHVDESGYGKLTWEYYHRNFHNKCDVSEYLW